MDVLFHVIEADTFYNALLRWPLIHTSKAIASILHQCLKYIDRHSNEGIRRVCKSFQGGWC